MLQNLIQLKSPFLEEVTVAKSHNMASKSVIECFKKDDVIFKEGDLADKFYFVYSGAVRVEKAKDSKAKDVDNTVAVVGYLNPGDYFGELALINDNPRLASCVSDEATIVLSILKAHFFDCFVDKPDLLTEFIVRMQGRKVELKILLDHNSARQTFIEHLETEHGMENLDFYEEVSSFEKAFVEMSDEETTDKSTAIVDKYVRESAPASVNLPSKIAGPIIKAVEDQDLQEDTFTKGKTEIYNLMNRDLYQRFKKTKLFDELMKKLHTYDETDQEFSA